MLHSLQGNLFRFAHFKMQEFLAAWYMVKGKTLKIEGVHKFFSDNLTKGIWQQVLQFVVGLLDDEDILVKVLEYCRQSLTEKKILSTEEAETEESGKSRQICLPIKIDQNLAPTWCKFVVECRKLEIVSKEIGRILCDVRDLSDCGLTPLDCQTVALASQHIGGDKISRIRINDKYIGPSGCRDIGELLHVNKNLMILEIDMETTDVGGNIFVLPYQSQSLKSKR
ncbi:uncharacterized protein LOC111332075 [Stylophora pistillata]|uniref:uncharacterized protein LOC111332075 n=1 Tax=Stylophora pistillata TaxID=50429 RepID=UPI000C03A395|nr:uncharacterized protein LOC111332075 [Stylophora pistillata]